MLGRPQRVEPLLESLGRARNNATVEPLFLLTDGDRDELHAVQAADAHHLILPGARQSGDYARKMNMGHDNARLAGIPWVFLGADDLCFCDYWADEALAVAAHTGAEVVGTNDLGNPAVMRGRASTHTLVSTGYTGTYDVPDRLLCEEYDHNFVDVELVEWAKLRHTWAFADRSHVEHLHPHWGKGRIDPTYRLGLSTFSRDQRLHQRRRRLWEQKAKLGRVPPTRSR